MIFIYFGGRGVMGFPMESSHPELANNLKLGFHFPFKIFNVQIFMYVAAF